MLLQAPVFERKSVVDQSASKRKEAVPKNKMAPNLLLLSYYIYSLEHDFISLLKKHQQNQIRNDVTYYRWPFRSFPAKIFNSFLE